MPFDIQRELLLLIDSVLDEQRLLTDENSFVEMRDGVIHCVCKAGEFYFKVHLEPCDEGGTHAV